MIPINKGSAPDVLTSEGTNFQKALVDFATKSTASPEYLPRLKKHAKWKEKAFAGYLSELFSHYSYYSAPEVKRQLIEEQHGKCVFCECFIMDTDVGDVEHFRPKAEVTVLNREEPSDEQKVVDHPGYFWLSQSWDNLFLSCKQCNQRYKGNFFDVVPGKFIGLPDVDYPRLRHNVLGGGKELPFLLYPSAGNSPSPRELIRFDPADAKAFVPSHTNATQEQNVSTARAIRTIELVGLNRARLVEARANHLLRLRALFVLAAHSEGRHNNVLGQPVSILNFSFNAPCAGSDAVEALKQAVAPGAEFSALAQDAIAEWSKELVLEAPQGIGSKPQPSLLVNTRRNLRLNAQLELAVRLARENATPTLSEAEPDTTDLDREYNSALERYRKLVSRVGKGKMQIEDTKKQLTDLRQALKLLHDKMAPLEDGLDKIRNQEEGATRAKHLIAWLRADKDTRQKTFGQLSREEKEALLAVAKDQGNEAEFFREQLKIVEEYERRAGELNTLRKGHSGIEALTVEEDALVAKIQSVEEPLEALLDPLLELHEEVRDLVDAYKNRRASAQQRVIRAVQLRDDVSNLFDYLDPERKVLPSDRVAQQIQAGKGWPPRITGL